MERQETRTWDGNMEKRHKYHKNYFSHVGFLSKPGLWPKDEEKIPFSCHTTKGTKKENTTKKKEIKIIAG